MNIEQVLRARGLDFCVGSQDQKEIDRVAKEWEDCGFSASEVDLWLAAGCFCADSANALAVSGISPGQVAYEIGYAFANADLSMKEVIEACQD